MAARVCGRCGQTSSTGLPNCPKCGAPLGPETDPLSPGTGTRGRARDSAARFLAFIAVVLIVVGIVILFTVPFPRPYALTLAEQPQNVGWTDVVNQTFPVGSTVSGSWHTWSGAKVQFTVQTLSGDTVYAELAPSGSFSFLAQHAVYQFTTVSSGAQNTSVNGTFSSPVF